MNMVLGFAVGILLSLLILIIGCWLTREKPKENINKENIVLTDGWTFATPEAWRGNLLVNGVSVSIEEATEGLRQANIDDMVNRVATALYLGKSERQVRNLLSEMSHFMGETPLVANRDFMVR